MAAKNYRFKSGGFLLPITCLLVALVGALDFADVPLRFWEWSVLTRYDEAGQDVGDDLAAEADRLNAVLEVYALLFNVTFFGTAVPFLMLTYRAGANAHVVADGVDYTAGSGVWWHFVPIASLVKPASAMSEFYRASVAGGDRWRDRPTPPPVAWWWGLWLTGNVLGYVSAGLVRAGKGRDDYLLERWSSWVDIAAGFVGAGLAAAAIVMFRRMFAAQEARALHGGTGADPAGGLAESCRQCGQPISGDPRECGLCGAARPARRGPVRDDEPSMR